MDNWDPHPLDPGTIKLRRRGKGAPLVLIHCLGMCWRFWDVLEPLTDTHELIAYSLPGHHDTPAPGRVILSGNTTGRDPWHSSANTMTLEGRWPACTTGSWRASTATVPPLAPRSTSWTRTADASTNKLWGVRQAVRGSGRCRRVQQRLPESARWRIVGAMRE